MEQTDLPAVFVSLSHRGEVVVWGTSLDILIVEIVIELRLKVGIGLIFMVLVLVLQESEVTSGEQVHGLGDLLPTHVASVVHADLALAAVAASLLVHIGILGSDDDDTVGTLRTIDSGSGSVLEYVHGLDVGRSDVGDAGNRESIDDVERVVGLGEGTSGTNSDGEIGIRRSVGSSDGDTGELTLHSLGSGCNRDILDLVGADGSDGSNDVAFLGLSVTGNDDLLEFLGCLAESHVHTATGNRCCLGFESDVGELEFLGILRYLERVVTVEIGHRTDGCARHFDCRTDGWLSRVVLHVTRDGPFLREGRKDAYQREQQNKPQALEACQFTDVFFHR